MSSHALRVPAIRADLPPSRRAAFGRWVRAVYGVVAHLDTCAEGCTAEQTQCDAGDAIVDDEQEAWHVWRDTR